MEQKHVLVVGSGKLFEAGLASLIGDSESCQVRGILFTDLNQFQYEIVHFQPQVLIIERQVFQNHLCELEQILCSVREWRLIILSLEDNYAQVYEKQQVQIRHTTDLISEF